MKDLAVKDNPLGKDKISSLVRKFAVPSIVAMLVSSLYNIVDQLFIGNRIGELGNAATNVAFPLSIITLAIAVMMGNGGSANYNLNLGRGNRDIAPYYMGNAVSFMIISGVVLGIIVEIFLLPLLLFFGSPESVLPLATTYSRIVVIGYPFVTIATGSGHLIRADGRPKEAMLCNVTGAIVNVILDALFILVFDWGMAGAAWATLAGQVISGCLAIYYLAHCKTIRLEFKHIIPRPKYYLKNIANGAASGVNQTSMFIVQIALNNSLKHYGAQSVYGEAIPIAVAGIVTKVNQIFFSVVIGFSQAMQPIVSFNYGAKKNDRVKETYYRTIFYDFVVCFIAFLCFQIIPEQIIGLFGKGTPEYVMFAVKYFRIYMALVWIVFIQNVSSVFFTALGMPKKGMFLSLTRQIIFFLPLIVLLPLFMGIDGVVFSAPIADAIAVVISVMMVRNQFKKPEFAQYKGVFKSIFSGK